MSGRVADVHSMCVDAREGRASWNVASNIDV